MRTTASQVGWCGQTLLRLHGERVAKVHHQSSAQAPLADRRTAMNRNGKESRMIRTWLSVKICRSVFLAGMALLSTALAPHTAWGQWSGTSPLWTNSNVGIGTSTPGAKLEVAGNGRNL